MEHARSLSWRLCDGDAITKRRIVFAVSIVITQNTQDIGDRPTFSQRFLMVSFRIVSAHSNHVPWPCDQVDKSGETTFYDSVSGKPLFIAPRGRTFDAFKWVEPFVCPLLLPWLVCTRRSRKESDSHGWPSFRDDEVWNATHFSLSCGLNSKYFE